MPDTSRVEVVGFDYELDDGESLLSVKPGDELEYLKPHGGPFRVVANDGYQVTLQRIDVNRTVQRFTTLEEPSE